MSRKSSRGKEPVVITVEGQEVVLQEPCSHCKGGVYGSYHPHAGRTKVGPCFECNDGLVDTPLFKAVKRHLGIIDELKGSWSGKPKYLLSSEIEGPLHFYPDDWRNRLDYKRALCHVGPNRDQAVIHPKDSEASEPQYCKNCLRIKQARERE